MLPRDFSETFNAAVGTQDWGLVINLGESAVAENSASIDILYNLGLAYLKTNKAPMAVSVFLSVPASQQDVSFRAARDEALRLVGSSKNDLEIGAHGFTGVLTSVAQSVSGVDLYGWCVTSLGLSLATGALFLFGKRVVRRKFLNASLIVVCAGSLALTLVSATGLTISYFFQSHWGAIVATEAAPLRAVASEKAEPLKTLNPGKPVMVLGDAKTPWLRVLDADGDSGWMSALDLRVIH